MSEEVLCEVRNHVGYVTLNRASKGNSLTPRMTQRLTRVLAQLEADSRVMLVVLTGKGRFFCTGMDLSGASPSSASSVDVFQALRDFPKPTVARINGAAVGGGNGLVWACDFRVALSSAYFWFSEVTRGLVPALISAVIAPQLGAAKSKEYMMLGRRLSAQRLLEDGQLNAVVATRALLDRWVEDAAQSLRRCAPGALRMTKEALHAYQGGDAEANRAVAQRLFSRMMSSPEAAHGIACFREKRVPDWTAKL